MSQHINIISLGKAKVTRKETYIGYNHKLIWLKQIEIDKKQFNSKDNYPMAYNHILSIKKLKPKQSKLKLCYPKLNKQVEGRGETTSTKQTGQYPKCTEKSVNQVQS
jgi:hypothetical protein